MSRLKIFVKATDIFSMGWNCAIIKRINTEDPVELVALHSLPESWGTGLGHAMLAEALSRIGDRPVYLWVFQENHRARRFYEKHGFYWDGTQRISEFDGAVEIRYFKK